MRAVWYIMGFLGGICFSALVAYIDGYFYRRSTRGTRDEAIERLGLASGQLVKLLERMQQPPPEVVELLNRLRGIPH